MARVIVVGSEGWTRYGKLVMSDEPQGLGFFAEYILIFDEDSLVVNWRLNGAALSHCVNASCDLNDDVCVTIQKNSDSKGFGAVYSLNFRLFQDDDEGELLELYAAESKKVAEFLGNLTKEKYLKTLRGSCNYKKWPRSKDFVDEMLDAVEENRALRLRIEQARSKGYRV